LENFGRIFKTNLATLALIYHVFSVHRRKSSWQTIWIFKNFIFALTGFDRFRSHVGQGCQIIRDPTYQNWERLTKWQQNVPNGCKLFPMGIKFIKKISIPRPSKIYPNWDFWYANKSSGNPDVGINRIILRFWRELSHPFWREIWTLDLFLLLRRRLTEYKATVNASRHLLRPVHVGWNYKNWSQLSTYDTLKKLWMMHLCRRNTLRRKRFLMILPLKHFDIT
jgi:hypothetical protein